MISNNIKTSISRKVLLLILVSIIGSYTIKIQAQITTINGPTSVNVNDTDLYTVSINDNLYYSEWLVEFGITQYETSTSVQVTWNLAGYQDISYDAEGDYGWYYGGKSVLVGSSAPPSMPPMPSITNNCGSTVLTRTTPPSGETYYWQSTSTGTSTSSSSISITRTSGTVYYLRSYNGLWSDARVINYTIDQPTTWYADSDGDSLGDPNDTLSACSQPIGYVSNSDDQCPTLNGPLSNNGCPLGGATTYITNFESGFGDWSQETYEDFDWTRKTGATSSSGTGPTVASEGSYYIYTEASSPNYPSKTAVITSIPYALGADPTFTFDYHMYGATMGQLTLSASTNGGSTWQTIWSKQGDQGNLWHTAQVDLSSYQNTSVKFRFTGVTGSSYTGDMSIDNIQISFQNVGDLETTVSDDENYIYLITPITTTTDITSLDTSERMESITYFDGLGRPKQQIAIRGGGSNQDIITHIGYDNYGRQTKEYLPYPTLDAIGSYRLTAKDDTNTYYLTNYGTEVDAIEPNPYSEKNLETSPLNRVLEQAAPGESWKLGNGHEIKFEYDTNTSGGLSTDDNVKIFSVDISSNLAGGTATYDTGELFKTVTKDENWTAGTDHTNEEFKDKQDRVILKRTYNSGAKHDTYYVYDDYGNLAYVLPPKMEASTASLATLTSQLNELGYQYKYDHRNRLIEKRIPGKGWEYIVYDELDRPVLTQDANQRVKSSTSDEWLFTKYDALGRVIYTGIFQAPENTQRTTLQTTFNNKTIVQNYEVKLTTSGSLGIYYSNDDYPNSGLTVLTVNYYDNYTFNTDGLTVPSWTNYDATISGTNLKGLATGNKIKVLDTSNWITTVTGYDAFKRPIWVGTKNTFLSTSTIVESKLKKDANDIAGWLWETKTKHTKTGKSDLITYDKYTYDHMGKMLTHIANVEGQPEEFIAQNEYDELGQLKSKKVGGKTTIGLQTVDYTYNIRGWLKEINDIANTNKLFNFSISYDSGTNPLFNGNISQTKWRTANTDSSLKTYDNTYDALNRIKTAVDNTNKYSLSSIAYDKNGNITSLTRRGHLNSTATSFGVMDNLVYTYTANSNKLIKVLDNGNDYFGFIDGTNVTTEYGYDQNGNLITDANKGITSVTYNHLDLPTTVAINGQNISYIYDAIGVKLRKIVNGTTTDYAGNYVYENGNLRQFSHSEGYVEPDGSGGYTYVYNYKDQVQNVRLSYADLDGNGSINPSTEILHERSYYPFGLLHKGYNNQINGVVSNYKQYQDQEFTEGLGLNVHEWKYRFSDPAIGRFWSVDPLAEDYVHNGVYNFSENRVIDALELEGLEALQVAEAMENQASRSASDTKKMEKPKAVDKTTRLQGWNKAVSNFNSNLFGTINEFGRNPIGVVGSFTHNSIMGMGQLLHDVIPGLSSIDGIENKTGNAIVSAVESIGDIPNMSKAEQGALAAGIFLTIVEGAVSKKLPSSTFINITKSSRGKSFITNLETNVTYKDFGRNLESNGFIKSVSKDGKVTIYTNGNQKYSLRAAEGKKAATAEYYNGNEKKHKIRLGAIE